MNPFLYRIAESYYSHFKETINEFCFVFPNRRAGLFFQRYLSEVAQKPIFSPEILTINECFASASTYQTADQLDNLFRIFRIYKKLSSSDESFDSFVFWGELLLSDFDEIDKYRVNAQQLFTNITELKQLDQLFNIFSEKQIEAIRLFWSNFIPVSESKTQVDFISTWKVLYDVYDQFRTELMSENLATDGMICRDVSDRLQAKMDIPEWKNKKFIFVGFNALNPCERTLMAALQKRGQADFYWDYEADEVRDAENPSSMFYVENTHLFPSKFPIERQTQSLHDKEIELIAVPSAVGQAKQTYELLNQLFPAASDQPKGMHTAIVLPDENLLLPLLHSLPEQIEKINVTMGFPLKATPISGLIEHIFELHRRVRNSKGEVAFYHKTVANILQHQYISMLCADETERLLRQMNENNWIYVNSNELTAHPLLASIFIPQTDSLEFLRYLLQILRNLQNAWQSAAENNHSFQLECDFMYQYYITLNRMTGILESNLIELTLNLDTLMRLIRQMLSRMTIPFIGEPLEGLQVMGMLETRGLDFENLIITSFNEGIFPAKNATNSFIPYNLRKGFGLPQNEYHDAITSYNFYRLIHRAKRIFFLYDSRNEDMQTGEVSRFYHQLLYHYNLKIKKLNLSFDIGFHQPKALEIMKTPEVMEKIMHFTLPDDKSPALSASSINTYIDCPLQFYFNRIENVNETEEISETIEANIFGSIFHKVIENVYAPYQSKILQSEDFDTLISNSLEIDKLILQAFNSEYFKRFSAPYLPLEGEQLLIARILKKYIGQVLKIDKQHAPFRYISSEEPYRVQFPIQNGQLNVNLKGFIDRIDEKEGRVRILDYKTGSGKLDFQNLDDVFAHDKKDRPKFVLQTFLYGIFYKAKSTEKIIEPGIIYLRDSFKPNFSTQLFNKETNESVSDFSRYENDFTQKLVCCIEELFNPEVPFNQTQNAKTCKYCVYKDICSR